MARLFAFLPMPSNSHSTDPADWLTQREREVFDLLGQGLTREEAAERLFVSVKTVELYRRWTKEKLGLDDCSQVGVYAAHYQLTGRFPTRTT